MRLGETIGHIRLVDRLGKGGMGEVFVGFDETLERRVAVKAIRGRARLRSEAKARFLREARLLSQLDHPNICRIHDYREEAGSDVLVLELIEGEDLRKAIGRGLEPVLKLRIAEQVASALVAAHERGIVHRDLKPSNVMLTPSGEVKVLDFGLARSLAEAPESSTMEERGAPSPPEETALDLACATVAEAGGEPSCVTAVVPTAARRAAARETAFVTRRGVVAGSPGYMSPEQARGERLSTASDLYSFGLLLQHLFSERPPYPKELDSRTVLRLAREGGSEPVRGVPADVAGLIERLKLPAPASRPTAIETLERLRLLRGKPGRRLRNLAALLLAAILALGGVKYTLDLDRERQTAIEARDELEGVVEFLVDLFEVADPATARGETITAREILERGAERVRAELGDTPLVQARLMATIGTVYRNLGLYGDGEPLLEQALEQRRRLLGSEHLDVAASLHALASLIERQGRSQDAERLYLQALAVFERQLGREHPRTAETLRELGVVHFAGQRYALAEPLFAEVVEIRRRTLSPDHPDLAASLNSLGALYLVQGRYSEAESLYSEALAIRERVHGSDHPEVATSLNNLALLHVHRGEYERAEPLYRRALAIRERTLGGEHPDTASSLHSLGWLLLAQERLPAAERYLERALDIRRAKLGPLHPRVAETLEHLAWVYLGQNRPQAAEARYLEAIEDAGRVGADEEPGYANLLSDLAGMYDEWGRYRDAEQLCNQALALRRAALGAENPQVAESLHRLAHLYHRHQSRPGDAEELYRQALAIRETTLGTSHYDTTETAAELAALLREAGRSADAERLDARDPPEQPAASSGE